MSGRILAEKLLARLPGLGVLYVSGYAENAIIHQGELDAGVHFLAKPFTPTRLAEKVRGVLAGVGDPGSPPGPKADATKS